MNRTQQKIKRNPSAFLKNTYDILQNPDYNSIIRWGQDSGFLIKDQIRFQNQILPLYFKHQKYSSYVRQLNMYGFHKHRTAKNQIYFKHEQFRKGQLLLTQIKRKPEHKKKGKGDINQIDYVEQDIKIQDQIKQQQNEIQNEQSQRDDYGDEDKQLISNTPHLEIEQLNPQLKENTLSQQQIASNNELINYDENYIKLCELLLQQNRILIKTQQQFRNTIINYKKLNIQHERQQILTIQRMCQLNQIQQQNNPFCINSSKSTIFSDRKRKVNDMQLEQIKLLSTFNRQLMSSIKQLNDTNYFMFSSTSIEAGYSNYKIEAEQN